MPLGKSGFTVVVGAANTTPFSGFVSPAGIRENCSCNPSHGPADVPAMPGGYIACARKPTVRAEIAAALPKSELLREKYTAVRAFCTATSQLNIVASGVRNVPSTTGATPLEPGLLTTVMNTWAGTPAGVRVPAREG